jgi:hypothetical protein
MIAHGFLYKLRNKHWEFLCSYLRPHKSAFTPCQLFFYLTTMFSALISCFPERVLCDSESDLSLNLVSRLSRQSEPHPAMFILSWGMDCCTIGASRSNSASASEGQLSTDCHPPRGLYKGLFLSTGGVLSTPHRIAHGLSNAFSLRILSGITSLWFSKSLGEA